MNSALRAGLFLALLLSAAVPSQAAAIIDRFLDLTDIVQFQILVNGVITFTVMQESESYSATVPLIAPLTAPLSLGRISLSQAAGASAMCSRRKAVPAARVLSL